MSTDNVAVDVGEAMEIMDIKEVSIKHSGTKVRIPSNMLDGEFVKIDPARSKPIANLLLSRCNNSLRRKILCEDRFWSRNGGSGKKFLGKLRGIRKAVLVQKFGFYKGRRFMARKKRLRAQQMTMPDSIDVPLPVVGDHPGVTVKMKMDVGMVRKNGAHALWVELSSRGMDHIARMVEEFFSADYVDTPMAHASDERVADVVHDDHEEEEDAEDDADNDDATDDDASDNKSCEDDDDHDEAAGDDLDERGHQGSEPPPKESINDSKCMRLALFSAFQRGAR